MEHVAKHSLFLFKYKVLAPTDFVYWTQFSPSPCPIFSRNNWSKSLPKARHDLATSEL